MTDIGIKDLSWAELHSGVVISAGDGVGAAPVGGVDLRDGNNLLPEEVLVTFVTDAAASDLQCFLQFSEDGATWPPVGDTFAAQTILLGTITENLGSDASNPYMVPVGGRFVRAYYKNTDGANPVTVSARYARRMSEST